MSLGNVVDDCLRSCIRLLAEEGWDQSSGHVAVEEVPFQRPGCQPDSRNVVPVTWRRIELVYYKNKFDLACCLVKKDSFSLNFFFFSLIEKEELFLLYIEI